MPICAGVTLCVPLVACAPLQPLPAVQLVAFVDDQLSVALCPSVIEVGVTEMFTVGDGAWTETVTDALEEPFVPVQLNVKEVVPVAAGVTTCVPLVDLLPLQAPPAVQEVSSVDDQVSVEDWPNVMVVGLAVSVTPGAARVAVKIAPTRLLPPWVLWP